MLVTISKKQPALRFSPLLACYNNIQSRAGDDNVRNFYAESAADGVRWEWGRGSSKHKTTTILLFYMFGEFERAENIIRKEMHLRDSGVSLFLFSTIKL